MDRPVSERLADDTSLRERRVHGCGRNDQAVLKNEIAGEYKNHVNTALRRT